MEFVVYRDSWVRGNRPKKFGETKLLNLKRRMCCLGQAAFEAGVPLENLLDLGSPSSLRVGHPEMQPLLEAANFIEEVTTGVGEWFETDWCLNAMDVNDDDLTDKNREMWLKEAFSNGGHSVKFVDGIAPWFEGEKGDEED